jgi:hypothetical protein
MAGERDQMAAILAGGDAPPPGIEQGPQQQDQGQGQVDPQQVFEMLMAMPPELAQQVCAAVAEAQQGRQEEPLPEGPMPEEGMQPEMAQGQQPPGRGRPI